MDRGWVKSYRKQTDWEWYKVPNTAHLFHHLLLMANHKDGKWRGIDVPKGCLITSISKLSSQTGLSVKEVRTALNNLIQTKCVAKSTTHRYTLLKVENYEMYQGEGKPTGMLGASQGQSEGKVGASQGQQTRNKEPNNLKGSGGPASYIEEEDLLEDLPFDTPEPKKFQPNNPELADVYKTWKELGVPAYVDPRLQKGVKR